MRRFTVRLFCHFHTDGLLVSSHTRPQLHLLLLLLLTQASCSAVNVWGKTPYFIKNPKRSVDHLLLILLFFSLRSKCVPTVYASHNSGHLKYPRHEYQYFLPIVSTLQYCCGSENRRMVLSASSHRFQKLSGPHQL